MLICENRFAKTDFLRQKVDNMINYYEKVLKRRLRNQNMHEKNGTSHFLMRNLILYQMIPGAKLLHQLLKKRGFSALRDSTIN